MLESEGRLLISELSNLDLNSPNFSLWTEKDIRFSLYVHLLLLNSHIFDPMFLFKDLDLSLNLNYLIPNSRYLVILMLILQSERLIIHNLPISLDFMLFN